MHPYIAQLEIAQRHRDLAALGGHRRRSRAISRRVILPPVKIPYWRVSWSRLASPSGDPGIRAWMIVISARRIRTTA
jgi:hypothetical protein